MRESYRDKRNRQSRIAREKENDFENRRKSQRRENERRRENRRTNDDRRQNERRFDGLDRRTFQRRSGEDIKYLLD